MSSGIRYDCYKYHSDICQSLHTAAPGGGVTLNEADTVSVYNLSHQLIESPKKAMC